MQYKPAISQVFQANGYHPDTIITLNEFQIVMNLLTTDSLADNQSARNLARQIWKQTHANKLQTIKVKEDQIPPIKITTDYLVQYIVDAIEILTNRTEQCRKTISDIKQKQKQYEYKQDFPKLEVLQHKLTTLIKDNVQFESDLRVLTQPFLNESHRLTLIDEKNPRKNQNMPSVESIKKQLIEKQLEVKKKTEQTSGKISNPELRQYLKEHKNQRLELETVDVHRKACIWLLGLLIFLDATVMIVKFSFVNLMVFTFGMFVLLQPYRQSMVKIAYLSCMATLPLDVLWLVLYSSFYLSPEPNTGLTHLAKPYFQYIWFVTVVQAFTKAVLIFVLKKYHFIELVMIQQLKQEEEKAVQIKQSQRIMKKYVDDHYLPNLKEFAKIETIKE